MRSAAPVLHGDVRHALDPRPGAGDRDRARHVAARPLGVGRDGGRRRSLDRREPPDPRPAPQRRHHDPALQQPDLRAHEGPVLADLRAREGDEVDAARIGRPALQPALDRDRCGGDLRRARDRHGQAGTAEVLARPLRTVAQRSSRFSRTATSTTTARSTWSATRRRTGSTSRRARKCGGATGCACAPDGTPGDRRRVGRRHPAARSAARRPRPAFALARG